MATLLSSDLLLSRKRLRKHVRRKIRQTRALVRAKRSLLSNFARFGERSQIIRKLSDAYKPVFKDAGCHVEVVTPKTFSIIEDPVKAIATIESFAKSVARHRVRSVSINQWKTETYDLAAMALLDIVATEIMFEAKRRGQKIRFVGTYPKRASLKRFVRSMGIVKHLKIEHEIAKKTEVPDIRIFDKRNRHYFPKQDPKKGDFKSKTIAAFVDHINSCLGDHQRQLTIESRAKLCDYVGEILGNAEDHPGFADWTIQGYLDNSLDTPICEIAIFNFGRSIAETLKVLPSTSYTWRQIEPYVLLHHGQNFFGREWSQSDLLTLIALQGHVSSKNNNSEDTRGQGMGDLIDFFQRIHDECAPGSDEKAKMVLLSGGTYILFDGTYRMRDDERHGRLIAFNKQNSLQFKPDPNYVKSLKGLHFPGTVISIRFPLSVTSSVTVEVK